MSGWGTIYNNAKTSLQNQADLLARIQEQVSSGQRVIRGSDDPNDKLNVGVGAEGWVTSDSLLPYTIRFENKGTATAPAQLVVVTDQLSTDLDWATFQLRQIGFNDVIVDVPAGLREYSTQAQVDSDPNPVQIDVDFDPDTGIVTWTMESVDPVTGGLPGDMLAGFLPPNDAEHHGEGFVSFSVRLNDGLSTGDAVNNAATIIFDVNDPIDTNVVVNTIDDNTPGSSVAGLPASVDHTDFQVEWSGDDGAGSGVAAYDVYVSEDGGAWGVWLEDTTETAGTYAGQNGRSYAFYSVATDYLGHRQAAPVGADATTTVELNDPPTIASLGGSPEPVYQGQSFTLVATDVEDTDGSVAMVEFFGDDNLDGLGQPGEKLGSDADGTDGWSWAGPATWPVGQHTYLAQATDDDGDAGSLVSTIGTVSPSGRWVTIGQGQPKSVMYADADETFITVSLTGGGTAEVFFPAGTGQTASKKGITVTGTDLAIDRIELSDTGARSALSFKTKGGTIPGAAIGSISGNKPLAKLAGKTIDLVGDGIQMVGDGYAGSVQLHDVANGADIIMPGAGAVKGVTIAVGQLFADTDIVLGSPLKSLTAMRWTSSSLTAPWASSITIKGDRRNNVSGDFGADVTLTAADPKTGIALSRLTAAGRITNSAITANAGSIGTITAAQWDDGSLSATWAKTVMIKGNRRDSSITGDFGAVVNLTGQDTRGLSLNKLQVAGRIVDSQITFAGGTGTIMAAQWDAGSLDALWAKNITTKGNRWDAAISGDFGAVVNLTGQDTRGISLNKLQVAGTAQNATVRTSGSMGSLLLGATNGSDFLAGIKDGVARNAASHDDFHHPAATIKSVKIKGWKMPKGQSAPRFFENSCFSAATLGSISLLNVDYANDEETFGFSALDRGTGKEIKSITSKDTVSGEKWKWPLIPVGDQIDFVVRVL